jgi:hypothetical protein
LTIPGPLQKPGLAFRTAADDSRCICLAIAYPRCREYPRLYPLTYVYTRLRPVATEDASGYFRDFQRDCGRRGICGYNQLAEGVSVNQHCNHWRIFDFRKFVYARVYAMAFEVLADIASSKPTAIEIR